MTGYRGTARLRPVGPFSLRRAAEFRFGPTEGMPPVWDGTMRIAFALDDGSGHAGAALTQPAADGPVEVDLQLDATDDPRGALEQVGRILSLDHDGDAFARLGDHDPVLAGLQRDLHGQRPVEFPSPYEAAAWSVLSARWPLARGARVRDDVARRYGAVFSLAGIDVPAFPTPDRLVAIPDEHPDLSPRKLERLRGVARAALDGDLAVERLQSLGPDAALVDLQRLNGIGPFYATLIVLRACGFADAWLGPGQAEVDDAFARRYGDADPTVVAEGWRPFRAWAQVLLRIGATAERSVPAGDRS